MSRDPLQIPRTPLSVDRLALALTGYTITGFTGIREAVPAVLDLASGVAPRGPYTITDAAGNVLHVTEQVPNWAAERWAVRTWRQRCEATDPCLTREAVAEQLRLKVEIAALEAQAAALNARIKAIDAAHGDDIAFLDSALAAYGEAVEAHRVAECEWADYDVAETRAAA